MNIIVAYVAGALSLVLLISVGLILLEVSELPKSQMGVNLALALFFALVAWYAAYDFAGSVEAGEGGE